MDGEAVRHASGEVFCNLGFFERRSLISLNGPCTCAKLNDGVTAKVFAISLE